jgi:hypothetical protein
VLPSGPPDTAGASDFDYFGAHKFGIPSLHYFTPVYPDAIQAKRLLHGGVEKRGGLSRSFAWKGRFLCFLG